jgi:hypothetical protein
MINDNKKVCTRCKQEKDIAEFTKDKNNKDGLNRWCKECQSLDHKQRLKKIVYIELETKVCGRCHIEKDIDDFSNDKYSIDGHHSLCKQCRSKHHKKYYKVKTNEILSVQKIWQTNNWKKFKQICRRWKQSERGRLLDVWQHQRRKEIMEQLPYTFTEEEWQDCLKYFNYSCAYCGSKKNIQQDHFISIMNDGPYTKDNMVVACGFCNPSKSDSDFFEWYPKQKFYNQEREKMILEYLKINK